MGKFLSDDFKYFQEDNVLRRKSNRSDLVLSRFEDFRNM